MFTVPPNDGLILMIKKFSIFKNAIANTIVGDGVGLNIFKPSESFIWSIKPRILENTTRTQDKQIEDSRPLYSDTSMWPQFGGCTMP